MDQELSKSIFVPGQRGAQPDSHGGEFEDPPSVQMVIIGMPEHVPESAEFL
jgi:hypothetical protein